ncbi:MAG: PEP-CTERM sorting domain-containing protein [Planctomycetaceae bacterium]|nr:PEP-CTERM sorting domain-containing protein [Planctomycetaceae bacterium]
MKRVASLLSLGALSAALMFTTPASADTLTVQSDLSVLTFGIEIGFYLEENNPESFFPLLVAVGQGGVPVTGTPILPGSKLPGPVTPGFSNGLSAQAAGTIQVTPSGFSIDGAAITLLDSGLWQPGTDQNPDNADWDFVAVSADLGAFLEGYFLATEPDPYDLVAVASVDGLVLSLLTGNLTLDGFGAFLDPAATLALESAQLAVAANLGNFAESVDTAIPETLALSGTFVDGVLTIPVSSFFDIEIPTDFVNLIGRISVSGQIVALPEPSSFALLGLGFAAMGVYGYRRRK